MSLLREFANLSKRFVDKNKASMDATVGVSDAYAQSDCKVRSMAQVQTSQKLSE